MDFFEVTGGRVLSFQQRIHRGVLPSPRHRPYPRPGDLRAGIGAGDRRSMQKTLSSLFEVKKMVRFYKALVWWIWKSCAIIYRKMLMNS